MRTDISIFTYNMVYRKLSTWRKAAIGASENYLQDDLVICVCVFVRTLVVVNKPLSHSYYYSYLFTL